VTRKRLKDPSKVGTDGALGSNLSAQQHLKIEDGQLGSRHAFLKENPGRVARYDKSDLKQGGMDGWLVDPP
jgi:hypothetical protein